jgi:hypothetical protein
MRRDVRYGRDIRGAELGHLTVGQVVAHVAVSSIEFLTGIVSHIVELNSHLTIVALSQGT